MKNMYRVAIPLTTMTALRMIAVTQPIGEKIIQ